MNDGMKQKIDDFCNAYGFELTDEQKAAVACQEGNTLLLAVPGSGKTTVLLARIGFQIKVLGVPAHKVLAVTYTKKAADEMKTRFEAKFGPSKVVFKTINSLALEIYMKFCKTNSHPVRTLINKEQVKILFTRIIREVEHKMLNIGDIERVQGQISFAKNMMYATEDEINDNLDPEDRFLYKEMSIYKAVMDDPYHAGLMGVKPDAKLMDFDDQLMNAYWILCNSKPMYDHFTDRYRYINVDEAQDNSRIQHEIVRKLSERAESLFMVGDDDQSIYGFRAAFPEMLLNFRKAYPNARVLQLTENFRSDGNIVSLAQGFISHNKVRAAKKMVPHNPRKNTVCIINSRDRHRQYRLAFENALKDGKNTAILYRDNESAAVLAYYLMKEGLEFNLRLPEVNFFDFIQVQDILAYLKLALDPYDMKSFSWIARKGIIYPRKQDEQDMVNLMAEEHVDVFQALKTLDIPKADEFLDIMDTVAQVDSAVAIEVLLDAGYRNHIDNNELSSYRVDTLKYLAKEIPDKRQFLNTADELRDKLKTDIQSADADALTLSTVHSAKGREWDNVHYIDLSDVCYSDPGEEVNGFLREEYKRIFYVGITRARRNLRLYTYEGADFTLIDIMKGKSR